MIIPIRTDYRMTGRPWVNYALVLANVALYALYNLGLSGHKGIPDNWLLDPLNPQFHQFFSFMFLHGGVAHLVGNMIFLWVFGNAVNDRLGHLAYLAFYLAGGILSGLGYLLLSGEAPMLGASGAISAVTGAYLILLPRARVTLLVFLVYMILPVELSSVYFLMFQFAWNLIMSFNESISSMPGAQGGIAYAAHCAGYVFGILVAAALLVAKLLPTDKYDMVNLIRTARRRAEYRRMVSQGYDPFGGIGRPGSNSSTRYVPTKTVETATPDTQVAREQQLRREISDSLSRHDLQGAAARYLELIGIAPAAVLSRQQQLDIANQLMASEQYLQAADAYETFLKHYGNYEHIADIYLMLGLLYGRYLHKKSSAEHYLERAIPLLGDPRKVELAQNDLEALKDQND